MIWFAAAAVALSTLGLVLTLWQWRAGRAFPLHARQVGAGPETGVTLLKPLKGADAETERCLRSWFEQDWSGPVQVLFGIAQAEDPVRPLVERLRQDYPAVEAQWRVCEIPPGANAKVAKLVQLAREARHPLLVISDADVLAPPDLLRQLVLSARDEAVGVVNCLYRFGRAESLAARCEALAVNVDFWSQVLQSRTLWPMDFALGAVMAVPARWLQRIGGFEPLQDRLADDFLLGNYIYRAGGRVELCPVVVDCRESPQAWRAIWKHQVRWARTIRACRPLPYAFSILSHALLWPLVWFAAAAGCAAAGRALPGGVVAPLGVLGLCALVRWATAWDLQRRFVVSRADRVPAWGIWVKDLLAIGVWATAMLGRTVEWRGARYRVDAEGRLRPL